MAQAHILLIGMEGHLSIDTVGASAGSYSLVVSDAAGCTASSGPYTIGTGSGLVIDTTSMVVQDESCAGNSITGIVVSGGTSPICILGMVVWLRVQIH